MGYSDCLFSDSYRHRCLGKFQTKKREQSLFGGTFFAMAPHRILYVGNERGTFHADCICQCRVYYRYCLGQLCLVCVCLYMSACLCFCSPLFGNPCFDSAGVYGKAVRAVYPQYSGMVYNCYDIDFLVSIDFIRRWCSDSSGIRYTDVAVRFDLIDYFGILHNARRIEGCCLHECLSDDSVDSCFSYTGYRRNL